MHLVGLNESRQVVGVRWRYHMQRILVELKISLLPYSETYIFSNYTCSPILVLLDTWNLIETVTAKDRGKAY